jgi:hypothetical protein
MDTDGKNLNTWQLKTNKSSSGYFSSRKAATEADILVTPYQSILSESTREALGISLNSKFYKYC